jgi:hypothetical protein
VERYTGLSRDDLTVVRVAADGDVPTSTPITLTTS